MSINYPMPAEFSNFRLFTTGNSNSDVGHFRIDIPEAAKWLYFILGASGGNGGNGFSRTAGSTGRGGGGGGSGGTSVLFCPNSAFMPSCLYGMIPAANSSWFSYLSLTPLQASGVSVTSNFSKTIMTAAVGLAGGVGGASSGGAAGGGASAASSFGIGWESLVGVGTDSVGMDGTAGGTETGAAGGTLTFGTGGILLSGGTGGGGCQTTDFPGGNIVGAGPVPNLSGGGAAGEGGASFYNIGPYGPIFTGGTGGYSNNSGTAGNGGRGAPGCGGGGGGAGTTGGTGGLGGNGFLFFAWS